MLKVLQRQFKSLFWKETRERERLKENGLNRATKGRVYLLMLGRTDDSEKTAPDKDLPYLKYLEPSAMY